MKDKCNEWIPAGQGKTCICKYDRHVDVNKDKINLELLVLENVKPPEHIIKIEDPVYRTILG